jgi:xylulokinase
MNAALAIQQTMKLFRWDAATLEKNVSMIPPGARGLLFLPYLQGERFPNLPGGCGVLHGLNLGNMSAAEIARAIVEGITTGLARALKRIVDLGVAPKELRVTGGGSKSAVWRQIVSDCFGCPVVALKVSEGAALGAAIQAAWTYCQVKGKPIALEELVKDAVKIDRKTRVEPNREIQNLYAELQARQADLTRKLATGGYL